MPYIAGWNMPGYLPETEPETFETLEDARAYLAETLESWLDQDEAPEDVTVESILTVAGDAVDGWYEPESGASLHLWAEWSNDSPMHPVNDPSAIVWYGGMGHKILSVDGGIECYRCGMAADDSVWQELIPDCEGSDGGDHHWMGAYASDGSPKIECAYGDAWIVPTGGWETAGGRCKRA